MGSCGHTGGVCLSPVHLFYNLLSSPPSLTPPDLFYTMAHSASGGQPLASVEDKCCTMSGTTLRNLHCAEDEQEPAPLMHHKQHQALNPTGDCLNKVGF